MAAERGRNRLAKAGEGDRVIQVPFFVCFMFSMLSTACLSASFVFFFFSLAFSCVHASRSSLLGSYSFRP